MQVLFYRAEDIEIMTNYFTTLFLSLYEKNFEPGRSFLWHRLLRRTLVQWEYC